MVRTLSETSNENRVRIIDAYVNGRTAIDIADVMGLKRSTVDGIIWTYKKENRVNKLPRGGTRSAKLSDENKAQIQEWIDNDCSITLISLKEKCLRILNVIVSQRTIARCIKAYSYTIKRVHNIPIRRNDDAAIEARAVYSDYFMRLLASVERQGIIFVDEVGFNVSMRARRGRSLRGTNAVHQVASIRSRNISVCCAMNNTGILFYEAQTRAYNGVFFQQFLMRLMVQLQQRQLMATTIIVDNVPFHKCIAGRAIVADAGHSIAFLPPYSPFLNPIENMFSKWKQAVRMTRPESEADLFQKIEEGAQLVTGEDCSGFFRNMLDYIRRGLLQEIIED
jgi:transposase